MSLYHKCITLVMVVSTLLCGAQLSAQANADLAKANALIYESPDAAIGIAKKVYENPNGTVKDKVNALLCISTAYSSKRDYQGAQEFIVKIENLLPSIKDETLKMNILNRMGAQYQDLQIYDKAIEYLNMSLDLMENYPNKEAIQTLLGYNHTIRGFIYREQMNCNIALTYFDKAINAYSNTADRYVRNANLSVCYYNKGNCFLASDQVAAANASFSKAVVYAQNVNAKSLIAFGQKGLAEVKTAEGNYSASIIILKQALNIADGVGDLILNRGIFDGLANNYLAINDWENYNYYHQKFLDLQNETRNSERQTINQSLLSLSRKKAKEMKELRAFYVPLQIIGVIVVLLSLIFCIRFILRSEQKLKQLQEKLKH